MSNMFTSVFSFLTIIPSGSHTLEDTAKNMHAFPAIGLLMGFVLGIAALGLYYLGVDQIIVAFLLVAATMLITGLHHTDGLADFADGLMRRGTISEKLAAMRDVSVGTGGVAAITLYVAAMVAALSVADGEIIFWMLLFGESSAKFSMVIVASVGLPSKTGSSIPFVKAMRQMEACCRISYGYSPTCTLWRSCSHCSCCMLINCGSIHYDSSGARIWRNNGGRNRSFKRDWKIIVYPLICGALMNAIVMAGGCGTRMKSNVEKLLLEVNGESMAVHTVKILSDSGLFEHVLCATSANAPKTAAVLSDAGIQTVHTAGRGYSEDLGDVLEGMRGKVLIISGDMPHPPAITIAFMRANSTYERINDNLPISFEAPITSPVIPPNPRAARIVMNTATIDEHATAAMATGPPKSASGAIAVTDATTSLHLWLIALTNGMLEPVFEGRPTDATITMENFAEDSPKSSIQNIISPSATERAATIAATYSVIAATPPVPTDTSLIAASFSDIVPRLISPSAKSASPSV